MRTLATTAQDPALSGHATVLILTSWRYASYYASHSQEALPSVENAQGNSPDNGSPRHSNYGRGSPDFSPNSSYNRSPNNSPNNNNTPQPSGFQSPDYGAPSSSSSRSTSPTDSLDPGVSPLTDPHHGHSGDDDIKSESHSSGSEPIVDYPDSDNTSATGAGEGDMAVDYRGLEEAQMDALLDEVKVKVEEEEAEAEIEALEVLALLDQVMAEDEVEERDGEIEYNGDWENDGDDSEDDVGSLFG